MKNLFINIIVILTVFFGYAQTDTDGLYFDGVDDNITVPNTTNINSTTTNNRTYETSFKVIDATSTTKQIIMKEGGGTRAVIIYVEAGFLYLGAYNRTDYTPTWQGTFYREAISSDTWYHVALVFDNALEPTTDPIAATDNNALKWYLDGALMGEVSGYQLGGHNSIRLGYKNETLRFPSCNTWAATPTGSSEYCFGTISNDTGSDEYYFNGYIWGFRVWNDVRTQAEIQQNTNNIITTVGANDLVAALDGDTFTYLNSDDEPAEAAVSAVTTIIWSATAATTDWNTGSNWEGGVVPNVPARQSAEIQVSTNYPIINTHIVTGDVLVKSGAEITINSEATLEIAYDLTNDGTMTVEDKGSLILREKESSASTGTFNIKRATPTYSSNDFYSYWSSPVNSTDSSIATVFDDAELIYSFNTSSANSDWVFHGTSNFETGIGYAVQNEGLGGQLRTFSGNINKGDIVVDIYNTSNLEGEGSDEVVWSTDGDNLIGNPYSSAIDWDLVVTDPDNTEISGEVYFWKQNTAEIGENNVSDYLVYNLTGTSEASEIANGKIGTGQGFFIKTESLEDDLKITFKTTHQVANENSVFYKTNKKTTNKKKAGRSWFTFKNEDKVNTLLVGFVKGATNGYDRLYDALYDVSKTSMCFYTLIDETKKLSIQGLPELSIDEKNVKLGFTVDKVGEYSIGIQSEYIDGSYNIFLRDNEANSIIDLKESEYKFTINSLGENNSRFEIIYTKENKETLNVNDEVLNNNSFLVSVNSLKELIINYTDLDQITEVSLYNVLGVKVKSFSKNEVKNVSNLQTGVYIVKASLENNQKLTKKIMITN